MRKYNNINTSSNTFTAAVFVQSITNEAVSVMRILVSLTSLQTFANLTLHKRNEVSISVCVAKFFFYTPMVKIRTNKNLHLAFANCRQEFLRSHAM